MKSLRLNNITFLLVAGSFLTPAYADDPMVTMVGDSGISTYDLPTQLFVSLSGYAVSCGSGCPSLTWDAATRTVTVKDVHPTTHEEIISVTCTQVPEGNEGRHHTCSFHPQLNSLRATENVIFQAIYRSAGGVHSPSTNPDTDRFHRYFVEIKPTIFLISPQDVRNYGEIRCNATYDRRTAGDPMTYNNDADCDYDIPVVTSGEQALQKLSTLIESHPEVGQMLESLAPSTRFYRDSEIYLIRSLEDHFYSISFQYEINEGAPHVDGDIASVYVWLKGIYDSRNGTPHHYSSMDLGFSHFMTVRH